MTNEERARGIRLEMHVRGYISPLCCRRAVNKHLAAALDAAEERERDRIVGILGIECEACIALRVLLAAIREESP